MLVPFGTPDSLLRFDTCKQPLLSIRHQSHFLQPSAVAKLLSPFATPVRPYLPSRDSRRALPLESNSRPFITPHSWPCRPGRDSRRTLPLLVSKSGSQELNFHIQSSNLSKAPGDAQSSDWLWCLLKITPSKHSVYHTGIRSMSPRSALANFPTYNLKPLRPLSFFNG